MDVRTPRVAVIDDDDEAFASLMEALLEEEGYAFVRPDVVDADPAGVVLAAQPDVVVLDLRGVYDDGGLPLLARLRANEALADLPVLVCSADIQLLRAHAAELAGMPGVAALEKQRTRPARYCGRPAGSRPAMRRRSYPPRPDPLSSTQRTKEELSVSSLRSIVTWIALVAALILIWLQLPEDWPVSRPEGELNTILTWVFWILSIVVVLILFTDRRDPEATQVEVEGPAFARYLFSNSRAGLFWLPIRLFLGFSWLTSGWGKATGEGWLDGGASLASYWERAVSIPDAPARPPISYDWYRDFLTFLLDGNHEGWFSYLVVFGEIAVGLGLILGVLTGIAAFFGALLNMSFLLAGSASTNPVLFTAAIGLMLAWRVAGYYGVDRWLLPMLGTPWRAPVAERRPIVDSA